MRPRTVDEVRGQAAVLGPGSPLRRLIAGEQSSGADRVVNGDLMLNAPSGDLDGLILPHPRAAERRFVMGPIAEMAGEWRHPTVRGDAATLRDAATVGRDAHPLS